MPHRKFPVKYIFVTGGVVSSLGKGIAAASLGRLLVGHDLKVSIQKLDPYLNVDPGTMSPYQHGEVFVTEDGAETDLDLGHYERFINLNHSRDNTVTSGQVYEAVIAKERKGEYLGATVQVIPHVTNEIKARIKKAAQAADVDVLIIEIGGTVGDIESLPFLEASRQFHKEVGKGNCIHIHGTLVPFLETTGEFKTKPTQHSVKELRAIGIMPDLIFCRSQEKLSEDTKSKIALFCDTDVKAVISMPDVDSIYKVPLVLQSEKMDQIVLQYLGFPTKRQSNIPKWRKFLDKMDHLNTDIKVAIVGKYVSLNDAYLSVMEALKHASIHRGVKLTIEWVNSEDIDDSNIHIKLKNVDAILVPGGFGSRGIEGKIRSIQYARENNIPFLGICLGMQTACIEFARNVCGLEGANSTEFNQTAPHPLIDIMEDQKKVSTKGGTMRLGSYPCKVEKHSLLHKLYRSETIHERHRHRFEFNNFYRKPLEDKGLKFSGLSPDQQLVEVIELPSHPYFIASQFHPEFKSRPESDHPLFSGLIEAALKRVHR